MIADLNEWQKLVHDAILLERAERVLASRGSGIYDAGKRAARGVMLREAERLRVQAESAAAGKPRA